MSLPLDFAAVAQASPNAYMLLDEELRYVWANDAYCRTVGRRLSDFVGRFVFEAFPSDGEPRRQLEASLRRVFATGQPDTVGLIRYAIERPVSVGGGMEDRWWTATHTPIASAEGRLRYLLQHTSDVTELQRLREAADTAERVAEEALAERDLFLRAREMQDANLSLTEESRRFRNLFMQAPGFIAVVRGPHHVFEFVNRAYQVLVGPRDVVGKPVAEALPEVAGQGFVDLLDQVFTTGQPFVGRDVRVRLQRATDAPVEERFVNFIYQPLFEPDGSVSGVFVEGHDNTEAHRAQEQQRFLLDELNHRVKNTLATIQAIANQTIRGATSLEQFGPAFENRLMALSQTHNLLTASHWRGADLKEVLCQELRPYAQDRIDLNGERTELPPRAALSLGLVFHELATNAAKYGALSAPNGRLSVSWTTQDGSDCRLLDIDWIEGGGPPVQRPTRRGFGSRLIERSIGGELGGSVRTDYRAEGLHVVLRLPLENAAHEGGR